MVHLAIGSNIQADQHIALAIKQLRQLLSAALVSPLYLTRPWGESNQANFINGVIKGECSLSPAALLAYCQAMEAKAKRSRAIKNGPRSLDIDILLYGDHIIELPTLRIPHPEMCYRDFVLQPLIDISANAVHPIAQVPLSCLLSRVKYHQIIQPYQLDVDCFA